MKKTKQPMFFGVGTALITPFKCGEIDYPALDNLIEAQISARVDALISVAIRPPIFFVVLKLNFLPFRFTKLTTTPLSYFITKRKNTLHLLKMTTF